MNETKPLSETKTTVTTAESSKPTPAAKPSSKAEKKSRKTKKVKKSKASANGSSAPENGENSAQPKHKTAKIVLYAIILLVFFGLVCAITIIALLATREPKDNPTIDRVEYPDPIYSTLTGEEISDAALNSSPTFCVQIPNGKDGARPQAGLNQAAVIFEAIAEAGITRFAAVFQNANVSAIGPIRSLRPYYLEWDLPFDCTVVHAGGSDEAMAALRQTGARELNENYEYMWREQNSGRMWNNLFTSPAELSRYNTAQDWTSSTPKSFARFTPEENEQVLTKNSACISPSEAEDTNANPNAENCDAVLSSTVRINFSGVPSYNTIYQYDTENNRYLRSYANGEEHLTYNCPGDLNQPRTTTDCGEPVPVAPKVVVAMFVQESKMSDGYHENINTISSGSATIFQNGTVIEGTWQKTSAKDQIVFRDNSGNLIKFAPGQVWIAAVPVFGGSISWE